MPRKSKQRALKNIKGNGGYSVKQLATKVLEALPKGTFSTAGGVIGGALGGPGGAAIGSALGKGLSMFTGYGDYVYNDIVHKQGAPKTPDPNSARTIVHSEYVLDVKSPGTAFSIVQNLQINPGDPTTFPWLCSIAQRFTKYRFRQLIFEFRSTSSDYASGSGLGSVVLAPNYNSTAPQPTSKPALEALSGAVSSKPSNSMLAGVECDPRDDVVRVRYVRNSANNGQTQLTDLADFYVATSGLSAAAGVALGELWVHYTVELYEPNYPLNELLLNGGSCRFNMTGNYLAYSPGNLGSGTLVKDATFTTDVDNNVAGLIFTNAGQPSTSHILAIDTLASGVWWFGRPGRYRYCVQAYSASNFSTGTGSPYSYSFSDPYSSLIKVVPDLAIGAAATPSGYQLEYVFNIANPCKLTWVYNAAGWGVAPNTSGGPLNCLSVLN